MAKKYLFTIRWSIMVSLLFISVDFSSNYFPINIKITWFGQNLKKWNRILSFILRRLLRWVCTRRSWLGPKAEKPGPRNFRYHESHQFCLDHCSNINGQRLTWAECFRCFLWNPSDPGFGLQFWVHVLMKQWLSSRPTQLTELPPRPFLSKLRRACDFRQS